MNSPIFEFSNLTFQYHNLFTIRPFHICLPCSTVLLLEDGSGFCIFTIQNFEKVWGFALSLYESLRSYLLSVKKLRRVDQFSRVTVQIFLHLLFLVISPTLHLSLFQS